MLSKLGERIGASLVVVFWVIAAWFLFSLAAKLAAAGSVLDAFWVCVGIGATIGMAIRSILFVVLGRTLRTTYRRRYVS